MWMLKSYKSKVNGYGEPVKAAERRMKQLNRPYDLSKHEDRKEIGYCYLEWVNG